MIKSPIKIPALDSRAIYRRPAVLKLLLVALLAEIGYAVLNISTMPVYLAAKPGNGRGIFPDGRDLGSSVIGLVLVGFLLSEAALKGPMGSLADKYGPKRLMLFGPCITAVTALLTLVIPHNLGWIEVVLLILLRVCDGVGAAMLWPAAFALMGDTVEDDQRQSAMSLLNLCYLLGIALALPIGGIANDLAGVKWAGLILASLLFASVAVTASRLPAPIRSESASATAHSEGGVADLLGALHQIPSYLILAAVTFAGVGFPLAVVKLFATEQFAMSETKFGALVFPAAIAMASLSYPLSKFGERIGKARAVHVGLGLCTLGTAAIGAGMLVPALRQPWILAVGGMPLGFGFLLTIPAWMASVSDIDPQRRGANLGAVMTAQGVGAIIGAPIGAAMYEKLQPVGIHLGLGADFGRYSPFAGCALCVACGWLLSLKLLKEKPAELTPA